MSRSCFVGRPNPSFHYLLVGNGSPSGSMQGVDCIGFNTANAKVQQITGRWKVGDGRKRLSEFGTLKAEYEAALFFIKKSGFDKSCIVGKPGPGFHYLRR